MPTVRAADQPGDRTRIARIDTSFQTDRIYRVTIQADGFRLHGVGAALLEALDRRARARSARCLWLETQNVNFPAIQFYRRSGFRLCGLDDTLYDPQVDPTIGPDEVALFFTRSL